uniref:Ubiquitin-conjugating enzyme E2 Q2 n=1 Tax=Aceria tosichella TaxID=561515 RepID=A0A6G1S4R6_9ACAR
MRIISTSGMFKYLKLILIVDSTRFDKMEKNNWKGSHPVTYDENYPFTPPQVIIVYPQVAGGTMVARKNGRLTFCRDLLTKSGWRAAYAIEKLILQLTVDVLPSSDIDTILERYNDTE